MEPVAVITIPILSDNYCYLVIDTATSKAALVDPAEASVVLKAVEQEKKTWPKLDITHILTTHKHQDHAGGNQEVANSFKGITVVGGKDDHVEAEVLAVKNGDKVEIGQSVVEVFDVPCHTRGHVLFRIVNKTQAILFTGDTLFVGGCGRFFEGTAEEMYQNLCKTIASMPDETLIYCGHEYTVNNLRFGMTVEPENKEMKAFNEWAIEQRKNGKPTVPSTIKKEKEINPFMRVSQAAVRTYTGQNTDIEVMRELRSKKDKF